MALIPETALEEILSRIDIVELISGYIPLKRAGRSYKALCPFHHEKTPSFVVNPQRQIFHCFGCSAGGNAFGFIMQHERLEFPDAVEMLAKKAGVIIPDSYSGPADSQKQNLATQIYKINETAANFYFNQLTSAQDGSALAYLAKRGVTRQTIQKYKIGYAPQRWDVLLNYLRSKEIPLGLIEKAGLISPKDAGGYYDRFRGRLIIPIIDTKGKVVAFGARNLGQGLPKYVNSPETPVYIKGKTLFGLNLAGEDIRAKDRIIIVEGYFDQIIPCQAGVKNVVASCGTALTIEQIRTLRRYSRNVIMVYDPDNAGQAATIRSLDLLVEEDMSVRVTSLPEGCDPDSYVRRYGADKFREAIDGARDIFDYKLNHMVSKYNPSSVINKAKIVSEMLPLIHRFKNAVVKSAYLKKLAEELKIDETSLLSEFKKAKDAPALYRQAPGGPSPGAIGTFICSSSERLVVKLMLEEEDLAGQLKERISPGDFQDNDLSRIVSRMFDLCYDGKKINAGCLINHFAGTGIARIIPELLAMEWPEAEDRMRIVNDCIRRIKDDNRKLKQKEISGQLKLAHESGDEARLNELLAQFHLLAKKGS